MFSLRNLVRREESSSAYISTAKVKRCTFFRDGWDQYQHASGLLIITSEFDEALLVQRNSWLRYGEKWSITGGYRKIIDDFNQQGMGGKDDEETKLESSLDCAVYETIEELGSLPHGRIRKEPHIMSKPNGCSYETFILEINKRERKKFRPSLDYNELKDWAWVSTSGIREREDIHPGLQQFFREYKF